MQENFKNIYIYTDRSIEIVPRGSPPILRGGPPLGTISMDLAVHGSKLKNYIRKISIGQVFVKMHHWVLRLDYALFSMPIITAFYGRAWFSSR